MTSDDSVVQVLPTSIAPWLSVADATAAVEYYKAAFGAVEVQREEDAGIVFVAHLSIGEADFWLQHDPESSPDRVEWRSVRMVLTVDDPDAMFARAVAAGGSEVYAVEDAHGWHIGRIADPSGHHWEIGRPLAP
jgi:PhnB protein